MAVRLASFGPRELDALGAALPVARELTGHYFALPDDWFDLESHEVCTLKDLRPREVLGAGLLAQIRRLYRVLPEPQAGVLRCARLCRHHRICLQDHNLLGWLSERTGVEPAELFTCVLTHEYVHLVRFCRLLHPYLADDERRVEEEERVEEISRTILSRFGHRRLRRVARDFAGASPSGGSGRRPA